MQNSQQAHTMNALRIYDDGRSAAIVPMASDDPEVRFGLGRVLGLHQAPSVDLEVSPPWDAGDVGDCQIGPSGVLLTVQGIGDSFMGMRFSADWGATAPGWRRQAQDNGCVWLGFPGIAEYNQITEAIACGAPVALPVMPVLKLEVVK